MWIELRRGLCGDTRAQSIHGVAREHGVDRADVHLTWVASLHEVLYQGLESEDDILESLYLCKIIDEGVHLALALGERHLSVLVPESLVAHHCVGFLHLLGLTLEELFGQRVESIVGESRGAYYGSLLDKRGELYLSHHVVNGEHPRAVGQLCELLHNLHVLHEVDVTLLRDGQFAPLHLV